MVRNKTSLDRGKVNMKRVAFVFGLAILICTSTSTSAQTGLTGTWRAESTAAWTAVLRVDGTRLIGAVSSCSSPQRAEISEGKIDGNSITFTCTSNDGQRVL